jgi:hypothetical protein
VGEKTTEQASPATPSADSLPPLPAEERLVNLTSHEVVLRASEPPSRGEDHDHAWPGMIRVPPAGRLARVDDRAASLGTRRLNAGAGLVAVTRLRRSAKVMDLPPPERGTCYLVSRLTALAARNRDDLLFPFGEERDAAGFVTTVSGLAAFRRGWAPRQRWRDRRTAARARLARQPLGREWLTGLLFIVATALLSGFLALCPGAIDNALAHGWAANGQATTSWASLGFLASGAVTLAAGTLRWRKRGLILAERGTAYVIDEVAVPWQHEEKESVLADIRKNFARTLIVPGPGALGKAWQWQADADATARWDERVDELVRSFWAVHYNDDQVTRNALFTWAPWPVATAFAARATALRRGLVLHVRQRPSYGAALPRQDLRLDDPACDFLRDKQPMPLTDCAPAHKVTHLEGELMLTIQTTETARPVSPAQGTSRQRAVHRDPGGPAPQPPLLLLVRTTHDAIGNIPLDLAHAPEVTIQAPASLIGRVLPAGAHRVQVAEWRLDCDVQGPMPHLPWAAFPAAAEEIAGWIISQVAGHRDQVVLLATRMPQELAVGLGIQLGQRRSEWPRHAYPAVYSKDCLVVPHLRLGAEAVPTERV